MSLQSLSSIGILFNGWVFMDPVERRRFFFGFCPGEPTVWLSKQAEPKSINLILVWWMLPGGTRVAQKGQSTVSGNQTCLAKSMKIHYHDSVWSTIVSTMIIENALLIHYLSTIYRWFSVQTSIFRWGISHRQGQVAQQHILGLQIAVDHRGLKTRQLQVGCEAITDVDVSGNGWKWSITIV